VYTRRPGGGEGPKQSKTVCNVESKMRRGQIRFNGGMESAVSGEILGGSYSRLFHAAIV